jgi:NTE family protein
VRIENSFYGDGMVRMQAPLSPAIHMGSDKLLIIGGRSPRETAPLSKSRSDTITIGEISGTILNGLFFDSLDADIDRMQRINRTLSVLTEDRIRQLPDNLRKIPILNIKPSVDLAKLSTGALYNMPYAMSYLLRGIGVSDYKGKDLLSFLCFESKYMSSLLELGYEDTLRKKDQVVDFFDTEL